MLVTASDVGQIAGPAGIRFDSNGIYGYTAGTTEGFSIHTDGRAYFKGGRIDENGITVSGASSFILRNGSTLKGYLYAVAGGITLEAYDALTNGININANAGQVYILASSAQIQGNPVTLLGDGGDAWLKTQTAGNVRLYSVQNVIVEGSIAYLKATTKPVADVIPSANNTYDLGDGTHKYALVYASDVYGRVRYA